MKETDVYDYNNLTTVMKCTQSTIGLPFIWSIDKSVNIKWYDDASFWGHKDMRSHTGGSITMRTRVVYVKSRGGKKLTLRSQLRPRLFW